MISNSACVCTGRTFDSIGSLACPAVSRICSVGGSIFISPIESATFEKSQLKFQNATVCDCLMAMTA